VVLIYYQEFNIPYIWMFSGWVHAVICTGSCAASTHSRRVHSPPCMVAMWSIPKFFWTVLFRFLPQSMVPYVILNIVYRACTLKSVFVGNWLDKAQLFQWDYTMLCVALNLTSCWSCSTKHIWKDLLWVIDIESHLRSLEIMLSHRPHGIALLCRSVCDQIIVFLKVYSRTVPLE